jgi:general stress protein CsbA
LVLSVILLAVKLHKEYFEPVNVFIIHALKLLLDNLADSNGLLAET